MAKRRKPKLLKSNIDFVVSIGGQAPGNNPTIVIPRESAVRVVVQANLGNNDRLLALTAPADLTAAQWDARFETDHDGTLLRLVPGTNFYAGWVPLSQIDFAAPANPNNFLKVVIAQYVNNNGAVTCSVVESLAAIGFKATLPANRKQNVRVDARNCMWFAFAPADFTTSYGEQDALIDADHRCMFRPQRYLVPTGASATLTVSAPDIYERWRHGPYAIAVEGDFGGTGLTGACGNTSVYRNAGTLRSANINDGTFEKISLLFMWNQNDAATGGTPISLESAIGTSSGTLTNPGAATKLFFSAHDGVEWVNNSGAMYFDVTWTQAALAPPDNKKKASSKTRRSEE